MPGPLDQTVDLDRRLREPPPARPPPARPPPARLPPAAGSHRDLERPPAAKGAPAWSPRSPPTPSLERLPAPSPGPVPGPRARAPPRASSPELDSDVEVEAVEVHRRRAPAWRRLASWVVDGLLLGVVVAPVVWLVVAAAGPAASTSPADIDGLIAQAARLERFLVPTLGFVALAAAVYSAISVALMGATPGKLLLRLEVVGRDGRRPSPRRAWVRAALSLLSFSLLGLGCLLALFSRSGRALHDFLTGTYVVER